MQSDSNSATAREFLAGQKTVIYNYIDSGKSAAALQTLRPLINKYPEDQELQSLMGLTQLALKNPNRALVHMRKAYALKTDTSNGLNLSSALIESGDYAEAQKLLRRLLSLKLTPPYPFRERLYHNLGLIAEKTRHSKLAEQHFKRALEENPTFYLSQIHLANIYERTKRPAMAVSLYEDASQNCTMCYEPVEALTRMYLRQRQTSKAMALLDRFEHTENVASSDVARAKEARAMLTRFADAQALKDKNPSQSNAAPSRTIR